MPGSPDPHRGALAALLPGGGEPSAPRNDSICQRDMKADLFFLAGDRFRGRLTATLENDLASEFIASRFQRLGLRRIGDDGSYYHRFNLRRRVSARPTVLNLHWGERVRNSPGARSSFRCISAPCNAGNEGSPGLSPASASRR